MTPRAQKLALLFGPAALALGALLFIPPVAQDPAYHMFADQRALFGIANFADVVTNAAFLAVAVQGFRVLRRDDGGFSGLAEKAPYLGFFASLAFLAAASAYYHLSPDNVGLAWDRLAIALGFMSLFCVFLVDRIGVRIGAFAAYPALLVAGAASVAYWYAGELAGHGDLRFYGLVQFYPLFALPVMCLAFPGRRTRGRYVGYMVAWYGLAKVCEFFDTEIFALTQGLAAGHAAKHLFAALAAYMMVLMLRRTHPRTQNGAATQIPL